MPSTAAAARRRVGSSGLTLRSQVRVVERDDLTSGGRRQRRELSRHETQSDTRTPNDKQYRALRMFAHPVLEEFQAHSGFGVVDFRPERVDCEDEQTLENEEAD